MFSIRSFSYRASTLISVALLSLSVSLAYAASPELRNQDSQSYNYALACGPSTVNSSIDGNSSLSLSTGCTLTVNQTSFKLGDGMSCTIKDGALSCR
jgi:hypothetical protein